MKVFIHGLPHNAHSLIGEFVGSSILSWVQGHLLGPSPLWQMAEVLRDALLAAELVTDLVELREKYRAVSANVIPRPSAPRQP